MVSISLTPMLCSRFLREHKGEKHGILYRAMEGVFDWMLHIYGVTLHWVLHHRPVMLAMFVAVLLVTADLYMVVPKGFIPDTDNDNFSINIEAAQGTSYYQMVKYQQLVSVHRGAGSRYRELLFVSTGGNFCGPSGAQRTHDGQHQAAEAAQRLPSPRWSTACVPSSSNIPGLRVSLSVPQAIRVGGRMSKSAYDFTLYGPDTAQLYEEAPKLERVAGPHARPAGRHQRSADQDAARQHRARSRPRRRPAPELEHHLEHAVRRLRPAVRLHHLRPQQPVPRAARDAAQVPAAHRRAGHDLPEERYRRAGAAQRGGEARGRMPVRRASRTPASCLRSRSLSR